MAGDDDAELQKAIAASLAESEAADEAEAIAASIAESNKAQEEEAIAKSLAEADGRQAEQLAAMSAQEQDRLTINQMNSIITSINESEPMVSEKQGVASALANEYANNPMQGFQQGIQKLDSKYSGMRRVRKDGNCFYRGFLYRYLEYLVISQMKTPGTTLPELLRIRDLVEASKAKLLSVGYEASAMDMFWEMFLELLDQVPRLDLSTLHTKMNDEQGVSNHVVWFCRALSATQIKLNADSFAPFIMDEFGNLDVDAFCRTEVEPVNHECEQVQIIALTQMLQIPVAIEYLDASGATNNLIFPEESAKPLINLLYRPGHYDILYHD